MEKELLKVFSTIFYYSAFIILGPITTFFVSKLYIFEGLFGISNINSNVWSAVFAVIVLHIALGMYIYKAYFEADNAKPESKID